MATLVNALFIRRPSCRGTYWSRGGAIGGLLVLIDTTLAPARFVWRLHVMPVAVDIYLPLTVSMPILLGAFLIAIVTGRGLPGTHTKRTVPLASGLIAGEARWGLAWH